MTKSAKMVRSQMFSVLNDIFYDDITDMDTSWRGLADALMAFPYTRKVVFRKPTSDETVTALALRDISSAMGWNIDRLIALVCEMEELSQGGSSETLSARMLTSLRSKAVNFEAEFSEFITRYLQH